jgi:uroporphyrinogen decarboxylase
MTSRDRVAACLRHGRPDRVPVFECFWDATLEQWRQQGLPADVAPEDHFGLDIRLMEVDNTFGFPHEVVERTEEYVVERDGWGYLKRNWTDRRSTPELLDFAVKSRADWKALKRRLTPSADRVNWEAARAQHARWRAKGRFICLEAMIGYDILWRKLGVERALTAIAEDPGWVMEIYERDADMLTGMAELFLADGMDFDGAWLYDDLAYRSGPLFSPRAYREQLWPSHRRVVDYFHSRGLPVILHSCGNITALARGLAEAGFDCLQPLEVKAGVDLAALVREYGGRLCFMGGVDVRALYAEGEEEMAREVREKLGVGMASPGGYVFHSDHSSPPQVSLPRYTRIVELVREWGVYR